MVNEELVRQLLKELEAEKGCPVQLRADTPQSRNRSGAGEYFGLFFDRSVIVSPIDRLDKKYLSDVELIAGEYASLNELQGKCKDYNVLYGSPMPDTPAGRAFDLVREKTGKQLMINGLIHNIDGGRISKRKVERILRKNGIEYFQHNIVARPDGVYDRRTGGGTLSRVDETKVADITLKLIE